MSTSVNLALANYEPRLEVLNTNIQARAIRERSNDNSNR